MEHDGGMNSNPLLAAAVRRLFPAMGRAFRGGVPLQSLTSKVRRQLTSSRRYSSRTGKSPINGKRECARRMRQIARDAARDPGEGYADATDST